MINKTVFFFINIKIKTFEKSVLILRLVYQDFQDCSLDIETGIKTVRIAVLILRVVSRIPWLQSCYHYRYRDFQDCSLDSETGVEKFNISTPNQDWYWDFQNLHFLIRYNIIPLVFNLIFSSNLTFTPWAHYRRVVCIKGPYCGVWVTLVDYSAVYVNILF